MNFMRGSNCLFSHMSYDPDGQDHEIVMVPHEPIVIPYVSSYTDKTGIEVGPVDDDVPVVSASTERIVAEELSIRWSADGTTDALAVVPPGTHLRARCDDESIVLSQTRHICPLDAIGDAVELVLSHDRVDRQS